MKFLEYKLPEPLDSQVEAALEGGLSGGTIDDLTDSIGGMLGKKQKSKELDHVHLPISISDRERQHCLE